MEVQPKDTSKGHFYVSIVKSFVRIGAGAVMILGALFAPERFMDAVATAGAMFIFAEVLGIAEELV